MAKRNKYGAKPVVAGGIRFDSTGEYERWQELQLLQAAGKISELERQVVFQLAPSVKFEGAKRAQPALRMVIDFSYVENHRRILEDHKSPATITPVFVAKRHMLLHSLGYQVRVHH
jgi:hypothetical protein